VGSSSYPDCVLSVKKVQVRAGRKVELWFNDLMRTTFKSIAVTLNHKIGMTGPIEKERRYIPQPCPKVWKKRGGSKTTTNGTAVNHVAVLKEMKRGNTLSQVNIAVLGQLVNANTGERSFYGSYTMVIRLEAIDGPNYVLPFDLTVVTSHNNGNNTTCIDIPVHCGFDVVEPEMEEYSESESPQMESDIEIIKAENTPSLHITPYDTNNPQNEIIFSEAPIMTGYHDFILPVVGNAEDDASSDYLASGTPSPTSSYASPVHATSHDLGYISWDEEAKNTIQQFTFQLQLPQPQLPVLMADSRDFLSASSYLL